MAVTMTEWTDFKLTVLMDEGMIWGVAGVARFPEHCGIPVLPATALARPPLFNEERANG
jgi:hypothetical protein